jgi:hypothetical protein
VCYRLDRLLGGLFRRVESLFPGIPSCVVGYYSGFDCLYELIVNQCDVFGNHLPNLIKEVVGCIRLHLLESLALICLRYDDVPVRHASISATPFNTASEARFPQVGTHHDYRYLFSNVEQFTSIGWPPPPRLVVAIGIFPTGRKRQGQQTRSQRIKRPYAKYDVRLLFYCWIDKL